MRTFMEYMQGGGLMVLGAICACIWAYMRMSKIEHIARLKREAEAKRTGDAIMRGLHTGAFTILSGAYKAHKGAYNGKD